MFRALSIFTCTFALAAASLGSLGSVLSHRYATMVGGAVKGDFDTFMSVMTPDFTAILPNGEKADREKTSTTFRENFGKLKGARWTKHVRRVSKAGSAAHVWVTGRLRAPLPKGHVLILTSSSEDDWVKDGAVWKLKSTHMKTLHARLDGKRVTDLAKIGL